MLISFIHHTTRTLIAPAWAYMLMVTVMVMVVDGSRMIRRPINQSNYRALVDLKPENSAIRQRVHAPPYHTPLGK
jgi:hypothetical protein